MQIGKEYLNAQTCKFYTFFLDKICKILTYNMPFYLITLRRLVAKLSTIKNGPVFFVPPCMISVFVFGASLTLTIVFCIFAVA